MHHFPLSLRYHNFIAKIFLIASTLRVQLVLANGSNLVIVFYLYTSTSVSLMQRSCQRLESLVRPFKPCLF